LQTVGAAASKVERDLQNNHPEVPWAHIIAMRNILVHDYFAVDLDEVWVAAERDIPRLKAGIQAILKLISSQDSKLTEVWNIGRPPIFSLFFFRLQPGNEDEIPICQARAHASLSWPVYIERKNTKPILSDFHPSRTSLFLA
jgi:hypothetical protein